MLSGLRRSSPQFCFIVSQLEARGGKIKYEEFWMEDKGTKYDFEACTIIIIDSEISLSELNLVRLVDVYESGNLHT